MFHSQLVNGLKWKDGDPVGDQASTTMEDSGFLSRSTLNALGGGSGVTPIDTPELRFGTETPQMPSAMQGNMRLKGQKTMSPRSRRDRAVPLAMVADIVNENVENLKADVDHTTTLEKMSNDVTSTVLSMRQNYNSFK